MVGRARRLPSRAGTAETARGEAAERAPRPTRGRGVGEWGWGAPAEPARDPCARVLDYARINLRFVGPVDSVACMESPWEGDRPVVVARSPLACPRVRDAVAMLAAFPGCADIAVST